MKILMKTSCQIFQYTPEAFNQKHTPWKTNGWNLKITCLREGKPSSKPPFLGSMFVCEGV